MDRPIHPLALAYLTAAAEVERHAADKLHRPTGVRGPAMEMYRARLAWVRAGCPIYKENTDE